MLVRSLAVVAAAIFVLGAPALAQAPSPVPDAQTLIRATTDATDGARSLRFTSRLETEVKAPGLSRSIVVPMSGEYQAPDRVRLRIEAAGSQEVIAVGNALWARSRDGEWQRSLPAALGLAADPSAWVRPRAADYLLFVLNPTVTEEGTSYRLSGGLDVTRAVREGPGLRGLLAMGPIDADSLDWTAAAGTFTAIIQKSTPYLDSLDVVINAPVPRVRGDASIRLRFTVSEVDSGAIDVRPPL